MRLTAALLCLAALPGCVAIPSTELNDAPKILQATPSAVAGCTPLAKVEGMSPLHGLFYAQGLENAKRSTLDQAAKLGATHVVWNEPEPPQFYRTAITATPYRCS